MHGQKKNDFFPNLVDFVFKQAGEVATDEVAKNYDYVAREVLGAQFGRSHHHVEGIGYGVVESEKDEERNAEEDYKLFKQRRRRFVI